MTPLNLAAFQGNTRHIAMAKWLLANGANTGARDYDGKTPLDVASERGNTEIADVIRAGDILLEQHETNRSAPSTVRSESR